MPRPWRGGAGGARSWSGRAPMHSEAARSCASALRAEHAKIRALETELEQTRAAIAAGRGGRCRGGRPPARRARRRRAERTPPPRRATPRLPKPTRPARARRGASEAERGRGRARRPGRGARQGPPRAQRLDVARPGRGHRPPEPGGEGRAEAARRPPALSAGRTTRSRRGGAHGVRSSFPHRPSLPPSGAPSRSGRAPRPHNAKTPGLANARPGVWFLFGYLGASGSLPRWPRPCSSWSS